MKMRDPRAVCNLILDEADGTPITNTALQTMLYFAHGIHLVELREPLVAGCFEAWECGPVHPAAYAAFRDAGDRAITFRAMQEDAETGTPAALTCGADQAVRCRLRRVLRLYSKVTPGHLVEIANARDAPWHFVTNRARMSAASGVRMPNEIIAQRFKYHSTTVRGRRQDAA